MASINEMRSFVSDLYPARSWKVRVSKMSDAQVTAIYFRTTQKAQEQQESKKENQDDDIPF